MENTGDKKQSLVLVDRKKLEVDNVFNVDSFNDDYLEISTALGIIGVEGKNLKIEELRRDLSKIFVKGEIDGIFYKNEKPAARLFKKKQI